MSSYKEEEKFLGIIGLYDDLCWGKGVMTILTALKSLPTEG